MSTETAKFVAGPKKVYAIYFEGTEKIPDLKERLEQFKDLIE